MPDDTPTGVPNPDDPGDWLVPPWPSDATFSEVVGHFMAHHMLRSTNTTHLVTYFEGYQAALETAPADEWTDASHLRWYATMHDCVSECVRVYREQRAEEIRRAESMIARVPTRRIPTFPVKAS